MQRDRKHDANTHINVLLMVYSFLLVIITFTQQKVSYAATEQETWSVYERYSTFSAIFDDDIVRDIKFCIEDVKGEWDFAFGYSSRLGFLANCINKMKGDVVQRLCTSAEIKFYAYSITQRIMDNDGAKKYVRPNKNCNLSSWVSGCEAGWACSVGKDEQVDLKNTKDLLTRNLDCQPCCEGFFCPYGLTCMMPCPMGSYCPLATLNKTTGVCDPYLYQLPPGKPNHTCGGAEIWADFKTGIETFCPGGYYCPDTTVKEPCDKGHYCRAGSTHPMECSRLVTCEKMTDKENITAYGLISFGMIVLLLIIIYNCSDKVLSTREKRQAKSREAAAKSAKETAQASQTWKSGTLARISRTFTRRTSTRQQDQPRSVKDAGLPPKPSDASQSKEKKKEPKNLTQMMAEIEENPDSHEGFNMEIGDKKLGKQAVNPKQFHTQSQIFRYAYGQIEKEKAFQEKTKNMTYSGVISMASDIELRSRPPIEVVFNDLTLTLKGKKKHLLRCVTGKLSPRHVSAVMGPSGAGKTTFLSALTGRATGCTVTGSILINGKNEPIQSYKKIIGFVPQDDIVHGNLTVEENLWFSARCRLPADMPMAEKVLVVERVIESLGLQPVRDSLVGTVEKRGISGGQKKRVNVGLEMVMEPSLLILDEPTTGLDSSSCQLLLRALRREALEGVNICMVLHQPSYTLFRMFDDLILLAKGGLIAYLGPVKKVEDYFSGLGINVPERVNPPDHYIDFLEGMVKPSTSPGVNYKDLPLRWMLHNGYPVPPDMIDSMGKSTSSVGENLAQEANPAAGDGQSFAGDLMQNVMFNLQQMKDDIQYNYLKSKDLSNRKTPGIFSQYRYFLGRVAKQRLREASVQVVDFLILLLAGICLGTLAKMSDQTFGARGYLFTVIAVSLLCKIGALRSFSDKLHYWRESSSGMSSLAYFLAKDSLDLFSIIIKPAVYLSMFYNFNNPRSSSPEHYIVLFCLVYCVTGIAYILAIYFEPGPAQLISVMLPVIMSLIANQKGGTTTAKIANFCFTKWALEAFMIANAQRYKQVWLITRCSLLKQRGYDLKDWNPCLEKLIATGIITRVVAYIVLVTFQKK